MSELKELVLAGTVRNRYLTLDEIQRMTERSAESEAAIHVDDHEMIIFQGDVYRK